jgi:hypothetical protein
LRRLVYLTGSILPSVVLNWGLDFLVIPVQPAWQRQPITHFLDEP